MIDPIWVEEIGRDIDAFDRDFYRVCCQASYVFRLGRWRARRRDAEARNDFDMLDRLDREYEMIGQ